MKQSLSGALFSYSNKGMRSNNPRTANAKLFAVKQAWMARFAEEGFPVESRFADMAEVAEYLNSDRIVCLRCGKGYKALFGHLKVHGWTEEAYKEFYGLPWRASLACKETTEKKQKIGRRLFEEGKGLSSLPSEDLKAAVRKAHKAKRRPQVGVTVGASRERFIAINGGTVMGMQDYDRVLRRMAEDDLTAKEAIAVLGRPSLTMFYEKAREDAAFGRRYRAVVEALSFDAQKRCQMLGERFANECLRLRLEGKTVAEIADHHGVSGTTVVHATRGFKKPLKTHCPKGHLKTNGVCKICAEERLRAAGVLPMEQAREKLVPGICEDCSGTFLKRYTGGGSKRFCAPCAKRRARENERRYKAKKAAA